MWQKRASSKELSGFLDNHLETLRKRNCKEDILENLRNQRASVLQRALEVWEDKYCEESIEGLALKGIYLAIPVIPSSNMSHKDQMKMVRNKSISGCVTLSYKDVMPYDGINSNKPYYIYDVEENNEKVIRKSGSEINYILNKQSRFPLYSVEVIALTMHTNVLSKFIVWAYGSDWGSPGGIAYVALSDGGRPWLCWEYKVLTMGPMIIPSCGSRI